VDIGNNITSPVYTAKNVQHAVDILKDLGRILMGWG